MHVNVCHRGGVCDCAGLIYSLSGLFVAFLLLARNSPCVLNIGVIVC